MQLVAKDYLIAKQVKISRDVTVEELKNWSSEIRTSSVRLHCIWSDTWFSDKWDKWSSSLSICLQKFILSYLKKHWKKKKDISYERRTAINCEELDNSSNGC